MGREMRAAVRGNSYFGLIHRTLERSNWGAQPTKHSFETAKHSVTFMIALRFRLYDGYIRGRLTHPVGRDFSAKFACVLAA